MKLIFTALFLSFSIICFGQNDSLKTKEKVKPYLGQLIREVKLTGEGTYSEKINRIIPLEVKKYIEANNLKGRVYYALLIDSTGKVVDVTLPQGGIDKYVDEEIIKALYLTSWIPASTERGSVARKVIIPINY